MQENPEDDSNQKAQSGVDSQNSATQSAAPMLSGASNGTIGPQGVDATYVTGINTAGTVRVNNLANLEALLNIIANGCELLFMSIGVVMIVSALINIAKKNAMGTARQIGVGVACAIIGLATPGVINWLVASARDANLFS